MKPMFEKKLKRSSAKSKSDIPSDSTAKEECGTVTQLPSTLEIQEFAEGHEDPEQSAELERQQDA